MSHSDEPGPSTGASAQSQMLREIEEQPAAVRRTLDALVPLAGDIREIAAGARSVMFIGRGSSDNAAVYGQYLCSVRAGILGVLASPSVATAYGASVDLDGVLAVAVSQSGTTEEIVETMEWARRCGARTVGVTNVDGSALAERADLALVTRAGPERAVPATKTYTTQLAALAVLGLALANDQRAIDELDAVPDAIAHALLTAPAAEQLAQRLTYVDRLVVSGRGYAFSTALELALKLKEACYVSASGLSYADLLHGPIAVVDRSTPALLVAAADGPVGAGMASLAERLASAGAHAYGIGSHEALARACHSTVPGTDLSEHLAPLALIVPGQLLVEALARAKGFDPDAPRGLSKVTQTDSRPEGA